MLASFKTVSVAELLEFTDRNLNEGSSIHFAQNFISEVVEVKEVLPTPTVQDGEEKDRSADGEESDLNSYTKIIEDGFVLYKNLCKLSMKFSSQERQDDQILMRGKILSLELLKVIMYNAGPIWCTNERQVFLLISSCLFTL
jgi:brefeldin A-inhibited guanine nucleotide-exchange protein